MTRSRSTLIGSSPRFIGCMFGPHPFRKGYFTNTCVYHLNGEWLIALSEPSEQEANPEKQYRELGLIVNGTILAPYVQRSIKDMASRLMVNLIEETIPGKWYWWDGLYRL